MSCCLVDIVDCLNNLIQQIKYINECSERLKKLLASARNKILCNLVPTNKVCTCTSCLGSESLFESIFSFSYLFCHPKRLNCACHKEGVLIKYIMSIMVELNQKSWHFKHQNKMLIPTKHTDALGLETEVTNIGARK